MRVLLDENMPRKLKFRLAPEHTAVTVPEHGWSGLHNGALLTAADLEFDAFLTIDQGLVYQQDLSGLSLRIVVVRSTSNKYEDLLPLVPSTRTALEHIEPGELGYVAG